ncbi:MAG: hypothetical protein GWN62_11795 [Aliifodinibius sp.]|nr:hypothetical protein [Fodinibius sp.]
MNFNGSINSWVWSIILMVFLFNGEPDVWDKLKDMIDVHYYQMITTGK